MKNLLTVAVCELPHEKPSASLFDGVELRYRSEQQDAATFLRGVAKTTKSKYTVIVDGDFSFADLQPFLDAAEKRNADILTFQKGYCFRSALLRGLNPKNIGNRYCTELFAAMSAKSLSRTGLTPFRFRGVNTAYSTEAQENLSAALKAFGENKAKMPKEVYTFTFDILCARLASFYMSAMLAIRRKEISADRLIAFDAQLKENIVLYLALEKRFQAAKLNKLRGKNFAVSFLTAKKFENELKK